jgi:hypothetical protein
MAQHSVKKNYVMNEGLDACEYFVCSQLQRHRIVLVQSQLLLRVLAISEFGVATCIWKAGFLAATSGDNSGMHWKRMGMTAFICDDI